MEDQINKKYQVAIDELNRAKKFFLDRFCDDDRVKNANVFITIQTSARRNNLGHFWAEKWVSDSSAADEDKEYYHEINICAEYMNRPAQDIYETLLHELAHLYNNILELPDCNDVQYHNKNFKKAAEMFGLIVDRFPGKGWALTSLSEEAHSAIAALEPKADALNFHRVSQPKIQQESKYINISLKKSEWDDFFKEKLDELGLEKPKELILQLLEELN